MTDAALPPGAAATILREGSMSRRGVLRALVAAGMVGYRPVAPQ